MKQKSSSYEPRLMNFPFLVITAAWIMLLFLWPHGGKVVKGKHIPRPPRIAFVRGLENLYSKPFSFPVWKTSEGTGDAAAVVPWMVVRPAKFLERSAPVSDGSSGGMVMSSNIVFRDVNAYRPVWDDPSVFNEKTDGRMSLIVEPRGALREAGFLVPDFSSELKKADKPWFVSVFVEVDDKGKVEHVFLDAGCENREINSVVVKSMYRGSLAKTGTRIEGRVTVNFGQE